MRTSPSRLRKYREFVTSTWVSLRTRLEENGIIEMALLSKEQIWAANDILVDEVEVPEWGGSVRVKGLSGRERDAFEAASLLASKKGQPREVNLKNLRARLIVASVVDENNQPLFDSKDVMRLGEKSAAALERVFEKAQKLSGMTDADVEDLAGNSDGDQSDSSTSD